tara:strand:- start:368 stop:889 length:522 start_codon:yes stop_codon:yes gene_type:complete
MFSGKSSEIIRQYKRYTSIEKKVLLINHVSDKRYGENVISSHDKVKINCISCEKLNNIYKNNRYMKEFMNADIVMIEEAQFFTDLYKFVTNAADNLDKIVVVSGLDGDYKREPFGDILRLIPHAEDITKLCALCKICNDGTPGCFTRRIVENNEQLLVGGMESYIPVCRKHYV